MSEVWDAYDDQFRKIEDVTLVRGEPIPDGLYHLVCQIIVKHVDGTYLLMRRDLRKRYGGMWELSAGGSAIKGEDALHGAIRELKEETGLQADRLRELTRIVNDDNRTLYVEYFCVTDCGKDEIVLQERETINYKWVDRKTLLAMGENELAASRTLELVKKFDL